MVELSPREEPVWGPNDASFLFPGRRRDAVDLVPPMRSSDDWEFLRLRRIGDCCCCCGVLPSGCWIVEANGRPPVSLGSDIADGGEGAVYI
jgi:hypothetical protein